ncbi:hypothetical protein [Longimicrobium sp.]|uniref:hypothetical protein n=1 Tax=Longimicrobium sp. TaxID=2029185 RepID=UPI003B3A4EA5
MPASLLRVLLFAAVAVLPPMRAAAQDNGHTLEPGDTVRVLAAEWGPRLVQGELLVYHTDSLALREMGTGTRYAVPLASVKRLLKNEGLDRRRSVRRFGVAGLFMGFATGVVLGPLISMERKDDNFVGATLVTSLGGGALGLGLGAASGALFAGDHWQPFRTPIRPPATTVSISIPAP